MSISEQILRILFIATTILEDVAETTISRINTSQTRLSTYDKARIQDISRILCEPVESWSARISDLESKQNFDYEKFSEWFLDAYHHRFSNPEFAYYVAKEKKYINAIC